MCWSIFSLNKDSSIFPLLSKKFGNACMFNTIVFLLLTPILFILLLVVSDWGFWTYPSIILLSTFESNSFWYLIVPNVLDIISISFEFNK